MKVAIVGSRSRLDKHNIIKVVDSLAKDDIVVSGGCKGVDTWAEERAKERGLKVIIFKPNLENIQGRGDMIQRYYDRNKLIAKEARIIYAFVTNDRKGGTENTIGYAKELGRKIILK